MDRSPTQSEPGRNVFVLKCRHWVLRKPHRCLVDEVAPMTVDYIQERRLGLASGIRLRL